MSYLALAIAIPLEDHAALSTAEIYFEGVFVGGLESKFSTLMIPPLS